MVVADASNTGTNVNAAGRFIFNYTGGGTHNLDANFNTVDPWALAMITDTDGDGQSDALEQLAGTDSMDADSVFKTQLDGSRTLSWPVPDDNVINRDRYYTIEYTTNLTSGWQVLTVLTNETSFTDTENVDEPVIYYRVSVNW